MKKLFKVIIVLFLSLALVSCQESNNDLTPTFDESGDLTPVFDENDEVTLTNEELMSVLGELGFDAVQAGKLSINFDFDMNQRTLDETIKINANIDTYVDGKDVIVKLNGNMLSKIEDTEQEVDLKGDLYLVSEEEKVYVDLNSSFTKGGVKTNIEGKFYNELPDMEDIFDLIGGDPDFEPTGDDSDMLGGINIEEIINDITSLDGVKFYKKTDYFGIEIDLDKEILVDMMFNVLFYFYAGMDEIINEPEMEEIRNELDESVKNFEFKVGIVFEKNKLTKLSLSVKFHIDLDIDVGSVDMKMDFSIIYDANAKAPELPLFDDYTQFDPEDFPFLDIFDPYPSWSEVYPTWTETDPSWTETYPTWTEE